jgi:hypothetical protein
MPTKEGCQINSPKTCFPYGRLAKNTYLRRFAQLSCPQNSMIFFVLKETWHFSSRELRDAQFCVYAEAPSLAEAKQNRNSATKS